MGVSATDFVGLKVVTKAMRATTDLTDSTNGVSRTVTDNEADPPQWQFTWAELSGSLGDLGTFLPLVLTTSLICGFDLG